MNAKKTVATVSLAGCFGCHMSLLDIDERLFDLLDLVQFDRSPINDLKAFTRPCDIGLIEGGCCNSENVATLREFRKNCRVLISVGECAIMGGLPSMRNGIPIRECLEEAYLRSPSIKHNEQGVIPNDRELPIMLDKVYPCQDIVKVDYSLPGCPPRADLIWEVLSALLQNREPKIPYEAFKYD